MEDVFIKIGEQKLLETFKQCDGSQKELLIKLYGKEAFTKAMDVTARIKTFEDACKELGKDNPMVIAYQNTNLHDTDVIEENRDILTYMKLRIITAALNEGWQPKFTQDEWRWYPWFCLWTDEELSEKSDEWKRKYSLKGFDNFQGEWAGFTRATSFSTPSLAIAHVGSRLCYKSEALADYSGRQFADLWADFYLIRKK